MTRLEHTAPEPGSVPPPTAPSELTAEGVDPVLVEQPVPPRARRVAVLGLMALAVGASMALLAALRTDIAYFFAHSTATNLGKATELDPGTLTPNTFVRLKGTPMVSRTVRYSRLVGSDEYAVFPLAGQRDVLVRVARDRGLRASALARREFSGRLVTVGQLGSRFSPVRRFFEDRMGLPLSSETFVLLADEPPGSYAWALGVAGLCLLFVLVDIGLLVRWFRPLARVPDMTRRSRPS